MRSKKTLLLGVLAITVLLSACNKTTTQTQENFPSSQQDVTTATTQQQNATKSVYYMTSGKMMMVKDGQVQPMTGNQTLNDGTVVKTSGEVIRKDGSKMILKNGESITMDGSIVVESPYK
ncbi:MAG: hypothetical protein ACD_57C00261G0002 [uncultured bacterium]|nr:MAG: hypothetical protein ACD_57C00261G0002 [uncultured bacterium]